MKRLTPLLMAASVVPAMCLADLHDPNNAADYMIVTTQQLINDYPWINELAEWRSDHGRVSMVVATDSIWAEFGTGVPSDTVLKTFLHYAYDNWSAPQLKDVFIIGFHDVVPSHVEPDSQRIGFGDTAHWEPFSYLSDLFYATDPDSTNDLSLINVGRLPWTPAEGQSLYNYGAKVIEYETSSYHHPCNHYVADRGGDAFIYWHLMEDFIVDDIVDLCPVRDYVDLPDWDPWGGGRAEVLENVALGSFSLWYLGLTYPSDSLAEVWSDTLNLQPADFQIATTYPPPIVIGQRCDLGGGDLINLGVSPITQAMLANPDGGAIAYFGWSLRWSWVSNSMVFRRTLAQNLSDHSLMTIGDVLRATQLEFVGPWGIPHEPYSPSHQTLYSFFLLGDPGLVLPFRPTAVDNISEPLPEDIRLLGNYPNPFNAVTEIRYELNRDLRVSLKVYDVLGREAAALVNEPQLAGAHAVNWNAQSAASGVYFAVLQAGGQMQTIKMMMLK